jgi:putative transcriptional regulator
MYHYRECGLPNVYLVNGYREIETPYGRGVSIEDVEGLHMAIAHALVEEQPSLTGPEVRFIRKLLELTQTQLAALLGVEDQSVRRFSAEEPKAQISIEDDSHRMHVVLPRAAVRSKRSSASLSALTWRL